MQPTRVLVSVTGRDRPGVTAIILAALSAHDVDVCDIEQSVTGKRATLSVLVELRGDAGALRHSVKSTADAFGVQSGVEVVDDETATAQPGRRHRHRAGRSHAVIMGRQLRAGALGDIAKRIADVGANIESMWQTSGKETISVEMYVDGDPKHVHDSLITSVDDTGLEIAVEHAGSRLPNRRLLVLDADATLGADVGATRFAPCVTRFVRTVQRSGCRVAAIATAQRDETDKLAETLDLDAAAPVHDRGGKSAALDRLAAQFDVPLPQSVAVGDARRSGQLLGEAGMAVGVDTDAARQAAKTGQIDTAYLDSVLYVLGLAHASA